VHTIEYIEKFHPWTRGRSRRQSGSDVSYLEAGDVEEECFAIADDENKAKASDLMATVDRQESAIADASAS
jgi:hypothetical protein